MPTYTSMIDVSVCYIVYNAYMCIPDVAIRYDLP